jgi:hypothetical protein
MTTLAQVATLVLRDVGAPVTDGNLRAVEVWLRHENANPTKRNNPLNLHSWSGLTGQVGADYVGPGDRNVAIFDTIEHGVAADASNLVRLPYYTAAVAALRSNNPEGFLSAIAASPWSTGHYRIGGVTGTNSLLRDYNGTGTYGSAVGSSAGLARAGATASAADVLAAFSRPRSIATVSTSHKAAIGIGALVVLALLI